MKYMKLNKGRALMEQRSGDRPAFPARGNRNGSGTLFIPLIIPEFLHPQKLTLCLNNYMHFSFNCWRNNPALKEREEGEGKRKTSRTKPRSSKNHLRVILSDANSGMCAGVTSCLFSQFHNTSLVYTSSDPSHVLHFTSVPKTKINGLPAAAFSRLWFAWV